MLDHISLYVKNLDDAKKFYSAALAPLGYEIAHEGEGFLGMGEPGKPDLWISEEPEKAKPAHVAFQADDRTKIDAFYTAALSAGGKDNGKPGPRDNYGPNYYAAFVFDGEGNNIEVVCHKPA
ncbi:MAG TPA: VOC family protein [Patescibacteria group bacterium]|nr:VOC family protein [Patescibacteria group bacterium]